MRSTGKMTAVAFLVTSSVVADGALASPYHVSTTLNDEGQPCPGFVSYSIEFASFPEFAGLLSVKVHNTISLLITRARKRILTE